jgi:hypothetical protein
VSVPSLYCRDYVSHEWHDHVSLEMSHERPSPAPPCPRCGVGGKVKAVDVALMKVWKNEERSAYVVFEGWTARISRNASFHNHNNSECAGVGPGGSRLFKILRPLMRPIN